MGDLEYGKEEYPLRTAHAYRTIKAHYELEELTNLANIVRFMSCESNTNH